MKINAFFLHILLLSSIICSPAHAYLDPGTFSIISQIILAAIAAIVATYRLWLLKLKNFYSKIKNKYNNKNK